ncbi:N6-adenosine-methyltransferase MT-A70-like, partial [Momordica charantia]|uniref:N6-adenosine-methyltransferase MT-A70-like n=1 Tax=Momordica charantia TaxID=3673 RepID=A0A6J1CWA5_MOMCH
METPSEPTEESMASIKDKRQQLETRILTQHSTHLELLSSLQALVPDIVSSLDLSLKVVSSFNGRPFTPTPLLPEPKIKLSKYPSSASNSTPLKPRPNPLSSGEAKPAIQKNQNAKVGSESNSDRKRARQPDGGKFSIDDSGSPLSVVRSMVAVCLLERVPFTAIDSSTVLRKLENDQKATAAEKASLRELGGDSGAILAVEMALRSMAEDSGGVELEEFVVSGKSRVMVLGIDRTRLMKELPESANFQLQESSLGEGNTSHNQNQQVGSAGGVDVNGGVFGMGGPLPRPIPEMWMGLGDPNMQGLTPMFPASGPAGAMAGAR